MSGIVRGAVAGTMRAIRVAKFGGPAVMKMMNDVPIPKPRDNQVLVRVHAAGVNPVDTYIRNGVYAKLPDLPYTPGRDGAGVVEDVGDKVTKFKRGDRVYNSLFGATGSYAEFMLNEEFTTFHLHERLTFSEGAAVGIAYFTVYRALVQKANAKPGQTVLVHGASGSVGTAACQLARSLGLRVFGTAGTPEGLALVQQHGAENVFNHRETGYEDLILEATGGMGVNIILEMLANVNLERDLQMLATNGCVVTIGSRGSIEVTPRALMLSEAMATGVNLFNATLAEYQEMGCFMAAGQEQGWLRPVVGLTYPLDRAVEAHTEVIEHKQGTLGKIVLALE